jgi:hypothetical protein
MCLDPEFEVDSAPAFKLQPAPAFKPQPLSLLIPCLSGGVDTDAAEGGGPVRVLAAEDEP